MIDFPLDAAFQAKVDWTRAFVREHVEPLDHLWPAPTAPYDRSLTKARAILKPLQEEVRRQGLWACHLDSDLGGPGYGQVKLVHINEILGRTNWGPVVFGCQGPDSGNSEILARFGTEAQKDRWLAPLLAGEMYSCFSMTEPDGGADPTLFKCRAVQDGDDWIIEGEKWYSSHANFCDFLIVMAVTDPEAAPYERASMFIVPADAQGIEFVRETGLFTEPLGGKGGHPYVRYNRVRVPASAMLGPRGKGFMVAQSRLGGGRIHHAMRTIGLVQKCLDMMGERAQSRALRNGPLSKIQGVQYDLADSWIALQQFRLHVLYVSWLVDQGREDDLRLAISGLKVATATIAKDVVWRAMHLHGALGVSNEMPFAHMLMTAAMLGLADGPTEVHRSVVGRLVARQYQAAEGPNPSEHLPSRRAAALRLHPDALD
ncbi:MAG: acyl-CoA dehydrogenase family protein [Hydrogenophilaceae bacterium]|nr:acyl-CoA dehydrogenase family protein [Hydrogenophilaceae bacterium]